MKKEDVKDTLLCRKAIVRYIEYLEKGNERIPEDFIIHVSGTILSQAALVALKEVLDNIMAKLSLEMDLKKKTLKEAESIFEEARDKAFKHAILLEIKHKHTRKESLKMNPHFVNLKFA